MNNTKKVCLITPNHISTNPRLVKEASALEDSGYKVHIIFTQADSFESRLDKDLLKAHPSWTFDVLDWSTTKLRSRVFRILFGLNKRIAECIFSLTSNSAVTPQIINRNFFWQLKKAKDAAADLYIAHNLGAWPVARKAAKATKAKFGIDAEDFHRNELTDDTTAKDVIIKSIVENENHYGVNQFTAASPLIAAAYQHLFPEIVPTVILNVFPNITNKTKTIEGQKAIKLFWFSQTIGENRGLEIIVQAMGLSTRYSFELHLLGNTSKDYKEKLQHLAVGLNLSHNLFFYEPVPEAEIFDRAATCDIGMASETGTPYNREICLTNKIFTYVQAGLAVAATDTAAQKSLLSDYPFMGKIYQKENFTSLAEVLHFYADNRQELQNSKQYNYCLGQTEMNWERESKSFIGLVKTTLR